MPVPRRACDSCRAQKLKCRWIEEVSSCAQCQSKKKQCIMPTLPPRAIDKHKPTQQGTELAAPPMLSTLRSIAPNVSASTTGSIDERVKRLEDTIEELKGLLPVSFSAAQLASVVDSSSGPTSSSSGQTQPLYQTSASNETDILMDIAVPVPSAPYELHTSDILNEEIPSSEANIFALQSKLSLIQAEIVEELFSNKGRQQSSDLSVNICNRVVAKLEIWARSSPLTSADPSKLENILGRSVLIHAIMLEASLYEAIYQLHAAKALCGFAHHVDVFSPDNLRTSTKMVWPAIYLDAQRLLKFAALILEGPMVFTWLAWKKLDALIAALCTSLAFHTREDSIRNAMLNTANHEAKMRLYRNAMKFLEAAAVEANELDVAAKVDVCRELFVQLNADS